jgi:[protein-PII] uridylyltransferase
VAGTLAVNGLDVLGARAWSGDDGVAVEDFEVHTTTGDGPDWARVEADLRCALDGQLSLESRLAERARDYAGRPRLAAAAPARTRVTLTNDASETATIVEVRAPDRIGTLYRITRALADIELDIRHAKVASLGHEVVDVFYVLGPGGQRIADPGDVAEVVRAVEIELARL